VVTNRWDDEDAARWPDLLGQRVYTSRLLGRDPDLVLHGGGNTSVKDVRTNVFGDEVDVLYVKGSGSDLSDVDREGFACLRLDAVRRLAGLPELADTDMAEQLQVAAVVAGGPAPSVEAILHAILPARFVDHTHADAVVTLTNTPAADELLAEVYGDEVVVIPYVMPGFKLARVCAERVGETQRPGVIGMVLKNHGMFTWGDDSRESNDRMIDLVNRAESRLPQVDRAPTSTGRRPSPVELAEVRARISSAMGAPAVMTNHRDDGVMAFLARDDLATISQQGTVTPDHVIRTKPWPLLGRDVDAFADRYRRYFAHHRSRATTELQPLDPAPRVVLDPELGMCCAGRTPKDAAIAEDVYRHTMKVILQATALGGYRPVTLPDLFDVEYWELEQAKLRRKGDPPPLAGEVALVTGAASGIGKACAAALVAEGASVVGLDVNPEIKAGAVHGPQWLGVEVDLTDEQALREAVGQAVERFGGLDMLVLNAGVFPASARIGDLDLESWRRVMAVNLDANVVLLREAHPLLKLAPRSGRVVVIGSRNAPAPGPGAAAYSASKAALTQLARVTALEWAEDGVRVNVIHPDAVFDTAIWTDDVLTQRAATYGMTVEEYRTKNLLGVEVTSDDVARLCVAMCGPAFAKTTGAQVPVDGGNDRVV
jgi:rhamnose utilization protein RhaD (predicted bifunctional aldolase and dehydrogenase)/NAD(P)-dependent dehydrogenase (short-subunit alcohol dehydrogenase family)